MPSNGIQPSPRWLLSASQRLPPFLSAWRAASRSTRTCSWRWQCVIVTWCVRTTSLTASTVARMWSMSRWGMWGRRATSCWKCLSTAISFPISIRTVRSRLRIALRSRSCWWSNSVEGTWTGISASTWAGIRGMMNETIGNSVKSVKKKERMKSEMWWMFGVVKKGRTATECETEDCSVCFCAGFTRSACSDIVLKHAWKKMQVNERERVCVWAWENQDEKKWPVAVKRRKKNRLPSGAQRRKEKVLRLPNLRAINNEEGKKKYRPQARREGKRNFRGSETCARDKQHTTPSVMI